MLCLLFLRQLSPRHHQGPPHSVPTRRASERSVPAKKRKKSAAEPGGAGESEPDDAEQKDTSGPANETSEQIDDEELGVDDEKSSGDEGQVQSSANETRSEEHTSELK